MRSVNYSISAAQPSVHQGFSECFSECPHDLLLNMFLEKLYFSGFVRDKQGKEKKKKKKHVSRKYTNNMKFYFDL
jgi:hypothetical protein